MFRQTAFQLLLFDTGGNGICLMKTVQALLCKLGDYVPVLFVNTALSVDGQNFLLLF